MEEASVAGESPDRSKQRESSAEPTSGSKGAVPESGAQERAASDPRLAVARESESRGGVDTATRVFSVRDLKTEAEESETEGSSATAGDDAVAEGAEPADDAESTEDATATDDADTAEGDETGDARLRAAVAAWVRSGDSKGAEDAETAAEGDEEAAAEAGTDADGDAEDEPAAGAGDDETKAEAEPDAEPESDTAAEAEVDEAPEDTAADTDADEAAASGPGADGEAAASGPGADEESAASGLDAEHEPGDPGPGANDKAAASGPDVDDEAVDPKVDADDDSADPKADADEEAGDPEADASPESDDEPAAADGEEAPKGPPAPGDESGTGGAGGNKKAEGEAKAVDQPTAIFKRPTKPQVDQPTTMLKLGGTKPAEPSAAEPSAAERTSKFVALKPDVTAPVPQLGPERTAQQPLPPKPPLDLLAELTNTPPPPETPVRTIVRRVKIWTPLVLLLAVVFAIVQAVRPLPTPTLALTADDTYSFDGTKADLPWPSEGQGWMDVNGIGTMGNFGKQTSVPIGSVAKAMTAYIVLKDHPLKSGQEGEKITVDALAEKEGGYDKDNESTLNTVKKGDVLTEKQALSAVMIPSANNIARLLARWDAGSEAAFIKKMNDTAKELGMKNTTYTDASGLKESTVSTAEDQVKLGNELVKIPALMDITKLPNWVDPSGQKWRNYNSLVPYDGAIGIKTGTTSKAGGNLLFAATKEVGGETVTVVGAILGQHTAPIIDTVNAVSKTAMLAAQDALKSAKILKKGDVVGYVDDQLGGHTPIVLTKDVTAVGWAGFKVKLNFVADDVPHTAKAGTRVGTLTVGDGTSGAVKVPVALQKDLAEPGFTAKLKRLG
ncbi:D-alanyl-D-alanine carboxypeptidase [Streptomyces sp. NPDC001663]|uniref:D-alanyl-D-alanine carboxypeptidase n=1 Tax=Streptomyces sp. NPDC001663 TaxID=3364597 RepID=UPI00367ADDFA